MKIKIISSIVLITVVLFSTTIAQTVDLNKGMHHQKRHHQKKYAIAGENAPELDKGIYWIDANGKEREAVQLSDYEGKFKVIYCFQSWCPGCHSKGLPALQKMTEALKNSDKVVFLAVQTVFEGHHTNTKDKLLTTQKQYNLAIPFGHDVGNETTNNRSSTMINYKTGGTPWFIFIDQKGKVVFNDFHIDEEKAIAYLKGIE